MLTCDVDTAVARKFAGVGGRGTDTIVVAVAALFVAFDSRVAGVTVDVLEMTVPSAVIGMTCTTRVHVAVAESANDGFVAVAVPVLPARLRGRTTERYAGLRSLAK